MPRQSIRAADEDLAMFPHGVVRLTPLQGVPSAAGETLSLAQILDAKHLVAALLTTFMADSDWLLVHIPRTVELTVVADRRASLDKAAASGRLRLVRPEMATPGVQLMHTKLMVLFYAAHMRLVVTTANLLEDEWTMVHNAAFVQDFPLDPSAVFAANEFSRSLAFALHDLHVPHDIIARLNNVDFSAAAARIVTTVPTGGPRARRNMDSYGMLRLADVLREFQRDCGTAASSGTFEPDARLLCVGSSLGRLDMPWLRDLYLCAHGVDPQPLPLWKRRQMAPDDLVDIAVGFHTQAQVDGCRFGPSCGRHVMARRETYDSPTFPRGSLFRVEPRVSGALVHAKAIVARTGTAQKTGWLYIGSHNCTPAAWGRLCYGGEAYFNNYELGVVLPNVEYVGALPSPCRTVWNGETVPLPFALIWEPYARGETPYFTDLRYLGDAS
ncbi:hypothetical protein IWQ56_001867 [Coemansia nantahalensis]|nr:hypothetical protein IWQ56_001867 [Coemansia nantahalensis]